MFSLLLCLCVSPHDRTMTKYYYGTSVGDRKSRWLYVSAYSWQRKCAFVEFDRSYCWHHKQEPPRIFDLITILTFLIYSKRSIHAENHEYIFNSIVKCCEINWNFRWKMDFCSILSAAQKNTASNESQVR